MQKHVYAIGPEGVPILIESGHAPRQLTERRLRHRELTEIGIRHSLFVADIHTRMILLTRSGPIKLVQWQEGSALWDSVVAREGEPAIPVRPDGYLVLEHAERPQGKNKFHVFLEADRSTMSHERMAAKNCRIPRLLRATLPRPANIRACRRSLSPRSPRRAAVRGTPGKASIP